MIIVTVTSEVKEGCMEAFLAACEALRPKVLAEEGCLIYEHTVPIAWPLDSDAPINSNRVILVEVWESEEALSRHAGVSHGKQFAQEVRPLRNSVSVTAARTVFSREGRYPGFVDGSSLSA